MDGGQPGRQAGSNLVSMWVQHIVILVVDGVLQMIQFPLLRYDLRFVRHIVVGVFLFCVSKKTVRKIP